MSASLVQSKPLARRLASYAARYAIVVLALLFFLFPIFWLGTIAVKRPDEYFRSPPVWLPSTLDLSHFAQLVRNRSIAALGNSLIVTVTSTLLAVVIGAPTAYSLARFNTGGHSFAFWILSQRFLPPVALIFPIFLLFRLLRWVDTFQGLIVLYTVFSLPFVVWMLRGYFREVPAEIEESALVDGCSRARALWSIALPLALPGIWATAVFTFIFTWNEFLFALVLTRTKVITLPVALSGYFGPQSAFWGEAAALSLVGTLPVIVMTLLMQRYLVRGLTMGALK